MPVPLKLYYRVKPLIPRAVRLEVRHWSAKRKLAQCAGRWPILPGSETPPLGWPGWPAEKRFALVLTHDIEGPAGLHKCRRLAALEKERGFRSSFNFIPEGEYAVPAELRSELQRDGFEVGVHDLRHDGWLYRDREQFARNAARINGYLREWGAVGFRAGFMLHNLEWHHDLDVRYDASTFTTDPFEPQPDGEGTIFPFWVPPLAPGPGGYAELPYTLAQDSTVFLVLRHRDNSLWKQKLDWIAGHGGMAFVNVNPDYSEFESGRFSATRYPARIYSEFLDYVNERHAGTCWRALPRDVAALVASSRTNTSVSH